MQESIKEILGFGIKLIFIGNWIWSPSRFLSKVQIDFLKSKGFEPVRKNKFLVLKGKNKNKNFKTYKEFTFSELRDKYGKVKIHRNNYKKVLKQVA